MKPLRFLLITAIALLTVAFIKRLPSEKNDVSSLKIPKGVKKLLKDFKFVPMGSFNMGGSADQDQPFVTERPRIVSVPSFYMSETEVSNGEYLSYYFYKVRRGGKALPDLLPDTLVWREKFSYNEPYVDYYFRHPAYRNYPVVGIDHWQASKYAKWLADTVCDIYKKEAPKEDCHQYVFSLPTEAEWEYAALGGRDVSPFPWGIHSGFVTSRVNINQWQIQVR